MVEPTQEDINAAAEYLSLVVPLLPNLADAIRANPTAAARAFARHRIAAVEADRRGRTFSPTEIDQAVEAELAMVVAWLRDKGHSYAGLLAAAIANRTYRSQDNG